MLGYLEESSSGFEFSEDEWVPQSAEESDNDTSTVESLIEDINKQCKDKKPKMPRSSSANSQDVDVECPTSQSQVKEKAYDK